MVDTESCALFALLPRRVRKRIEGYGGVNVHLGVDQPDEAAWRDTVTSRVGQGYVVQQYVPIDAEPHLVVVDGVATRAALYTDRSAFVSTLPPHPSGGVVRASRSRIVNIVGGGGLSPFIPAEVLAAL